MMNLDEGIKVVKIAKVRGSEEEELADDAAEGTTEGTEDSSED